MTLALILAASENNVIGMNNKMPWHLPSELKYFRKMTTGKSVIMGRKTFESIGRPLPNRHNVVISRSPKPAGLSDVCWVKNTDDALLEANKENRAKEIMVIGGATIYTALLPMADRLYLTRVHGTFEGDTFFEGFDLSKWHQTSVIENPASPENPYRYSFYVYDRLDR